MQEQGLDLGNYLKYLLRPANLWRSSGLLAAGTWVEEGFQTQEKFMVDNRGGGERSCGQGGRGRGKSWEMVY